MLNKTALRKHYRAYRNSLNPAQRQLLSAQFCSQFSQSAHFRNAQHIACYWPLAGEVDTRPLIELAQTEGKNIYLPVISGKKMWFSRWHGENMNKIANFSIEQPAKSASRLINKQQLDLVIVPLVAFDRNGSRIGQGGGYYDRYFQQHTHRSWKKPVLIGAAYGFQETGRIPVDDWDVSLAGIVTNCESITSSSIPRTRL